MRLFSFTFKGRYPVGSCGVVVAVSRIKALEIANKLLEKENFEPIKREELQEISLTDNKAYILLDGEY